MTQWPDQQSLAEQSQDVQLRFVIDLAWPIMLSCGSRRRWMSEEVRYET
jgi:hypothetical protein